MYSIQAKVYGFAERADVPPGEGRPERRPKEVESPVHLCSLKKTHTHTHTFLCFGFRTVLVFLSWRSVTHSARWTPCLITVSVCRLNPICRKRHRTGTMFTVWANISINGESLSQFTEIPADAKTFHIIWYAMNTGPFFFLLIGKLVYMHWCVFIMYLLASVLLRLSLWWDSIYCIATYLPWYFGLALSAVIVRPWCRNHDLSDSPYPDPTSQLFTDPSSCLALSLPWIFLSIKCCMILTWPFECSQLTS